MLKKYIGLLVVIGIAVLFVFGLGLYNYSTQKVGSVIRKNCDSECQLLDSINHLGDTTWNKAQFEKLQFKIGYMFNDDAQKKESYTTILETKYANSMDISFKEWLSLRKGLSYSDIDSLLLEMKDYDEENTIKDDLKIIQYIKEFQLFENEFNSKLQNNLFSDSLAGLLNSKLRFKYNSLSTHGFTDLQAIKIDLNNNLRAWKDLDLSYQAIISDYDYMYGSGQFITCQNFMSFRKYYSEIKRFVKDHNHYCD